jgi:hypothetical protein
MERCINYSKKLEKDFENAEKKQRLFMAKFIKKEPKHALTKIYKNLLKIPLQETISNKRDHYRKTFCNPSCKGTIFEEGAPDKLSTSLLKELKKEAKFEGRKDWIKLALTRRKNLFKKNKTVLNRNFHKNIDAKTRKNLTDAGAISGCYIHNPYNPLTKPVLF